MTRFEAIPDPRVAGAYFAAGAPVGRPRAVRQIGAPLASFPKFSPAGDNERSASRLSAAAEVIRWPSTDGGQGVDGLLPGQPAPD